MRYEVRTVDRTTQDHVASKASLIYGTYKKATGGYYAVDGEFDQDTINELLDTTGVNQIVEVDTVRSAQDEGFEAEDAAVGAGVGVLALIAIGWAVTRD